MYRPCRLKLQLRIALAQSMITHRSMVPVWVALALFDFDETVTVLVVWVIQWQNRDNLVSALWMI